MKRIKLLLALVLFAGFGFGQTLLKCNMSEIVTEIVCFPCKMQLNQQNNYALIEFSVNEEGIIKVVRINACEKLKAHVINKLEGYQLICSKGYCGKTYQYKLTFKNCKER